MIQLPMLCTDADEVPSNATGVFTEQKWDGWRFIFNRDEEGTIHSLAGRNGSNRTGQPAAVEAELLDILPPETTIDCELIAPGAPATEVPSRLAHGGELVAVVFDVIEVAGNDLRSKPLRERRELLEVMIPDRGPGSLVRLSPAYELDPEQRQLLHDKLIENGAEGTVHKHVDSAYSGGRSPQWVKVKAHKTIDVAVVGFKDGNGRHEGRFSAFEVELLDERSSPEPWTTVKIPNDATIAAVNDAPEDYLGRVLELKVYGISKDGKPKHPTFLRWREDKDDGVESTTKPHTHGSASARTPGQRGVKRRNYGAMGMPKLLQTVRELQRAVKTGESNTATQKEPTGDYAGALTLVEDLIKKKGG